MKKVIIGDYVFSMKSDWVDLTLSDFVALCRIKMPEKLSNLYLNADDKEKYSVAFDAITFEDNEKTFPTYYGEVIKLLSNIPQSIVDLIDKEQREYLFNNHLFHFAFSTITDYPVVLVNGVSELYQPEELTKIKFKGETYLFPESLKINGLDTPMGKEPIVSFTEASSIITSWQKLSEGGAEYAAMIPAIYLRKKGEKYSEDMVMKRKELFKELTMDVIWSLFFYTIKLGSQSLLDTALSLTGNEQIKKNKLQIQVV